MQEETIVVIYTHRHKYISPLTLSRGSENFLFSPSALLKTFSLHLRTFSKIPAEGDVRDFCFSSQLSGPHQSRTIFLTHISAIWKAFPTQNIQDRERNFKICGITVKTGLLARLASRSWVVRKNKEERYRNSILWSDEFLCPECLPTGSIKDFQFLLQNQMLTTLLIVYVSVYREEN